jgi:hypothetical protein
MHAPDSMPLIYCSSTPYLPTSLSFSIFFLSPHMRSSPRTGAMDPVHLRRALRCEWRAAAFGAAVLMGPALPPPLPPDRRRCGGDATRSARPCPGRPTSVAAAPPPSLRGGGSPTSWRGGGSSTFLAAMAAGPRPPRAELRSHGRGGTANRWARRPLAARGSPSGHPHLVAAFRSPAAAGLPSPPTATSPSSRRRQHINSIFPNQRLCRRTLPIPDRRPCSATEAAPFCWRRKEARRRPDARGPRAQIRDAPAAVAASFFILFRVFEWCIWIPTAKRTLPFCMLNYFV